MATQQTNQPPKPPTVLATKVTQHPQRQVNATWKWLPKNRPTKAKPVKSEAQYNKRYIPQRAITKKWIPKSTLHAQGYYSSNDQIWIPKLLHKAPTVQSPPLVKKKANTKPMAMKMKSAQPKYCWRIKADFNKKKYPANEESNQATSSAESDMPSTSSDSIPEKAELLQRIIHHLMPSETLPFTAWLNLGVSA